MSLDGISMHPLSIELDRVIAGGRIDKITQPNKQSIVLSVPVCSGLSSATIADDSSKMKKNCNMLWNEMYALEVIKPKAYIFENAPALYNSKSGEGVRNMIEDIAERKYRCSHVDGDSDSQDTAHESGGNS